MRITTGDSSPLNARIDENRIPLALVCSSVRVYGPSLPAAKSERAEGVRGEDHDVLLRHALLGDEPLEHARHAGDVIRDEVQLRGPSLGPDRLGLDLAAVELHDLAVDRLGVAAVPGELELGELAGELELLAVDVLVVVHEQPDRVVRLVAERAQQRGQPVVSRSCASSTTSASNCGPSSAAASISAVGSSSSK